ncbi:MAG: ribonuclease P protein component, partial [Anaerolineae bacterium]|nr:ribonuclease P protein component [Anaerolineae bacterium]
CQPKDASQILCWRPFVDNSWPKKKRLRRSGEFKAVWSGGQSWAHALFVVWANPNNLNYSRIGIVASRKVGNAVARNRSRRLIREAARRLYSKIYSGWDLVIVARSALLSVREPEVEDALRTTLQRAKLYRDCKDILC